MPDEAAQDATASAHIFRDLAVERVDAAHGSTAAQSASAERGGAAHEDAAAPNASAEGGGAVHGEAAAEVPSADDGEQPAESGNASEQGGATNDSPAAESPSSPSKKKKSPVTGQPSFQGMSPTMRRLLRRQMASGAKEPARHKDLSPEIADELAAKRALRRKVLEFWSKGAHGYAVQDLGVVRTVSLDSCSLTNDDGEALAHELTKDMVQRMRPETTTHPLAVPAYCPLARVLSYASPPVTTAEMRARHDAQ